MQSQSGYEQQIEFNKLLGWVFITENELLFIYLNVSCEQISIVAHGKLKISSSRSKEINKNALRYVKLEAEYIEFREKESSLPTFS